MIYGTDISNYQSNSFELSGNGHKYEFVFILATQSTNFENPKFKAQVAYARKNNLVIGFYHFLVTGNIQAQAKHFKSFVINNGYTPGDIIACDWETYKGTNPTNAEKNEFLDTLRDEFPESRVILYCNKYQYLNVEKGSYVADGLWIADPSAPNGIPNIKDPWKFQQCGIINQQDYDLANFSGINSLRAWAQGKVKTVTPAKKTPTQAYKDVILDDVFPTPEGHTDSGGTGQWTLQTLLAEMFAKIEKIEKKVGA